MMGMLITALVLILIIVGIGIAAWKNFPKSNEISFEKKDRPNWDHPHKLKEAINIEAAQELHPFEETYKNNVVKKTEPTAIKNHLHIVDHKVEKPQLTGIHKVEDNARNSVHNVKHKAEEKAKQKVHPITQPKVKENAKPPFQAVKTKEKTKPPVQTAAHKVEEKVKAPIQTVTRKPEEKVKGPVQTVKGKSEEKVKGPVQAVAHKKEEKTITPLHTVAHVEEKTTVPIQIVTHKVEKKSKAPVQAVKHKAEEKSKEPIQTVTHKADDKPKTTVSPVTQKVNDNKAQPSGQKVSLKVQDKAIGSVPASPYIEDNRISVPALTASIPLSLERQLDNIELTEYKLQFDVYNELVMQLQEASDTLMQMDEQIKLIGLMNDIEDEIIKINSSSH